MVVCHSVFSASNIIQGNNFNLLVTQGNTLGIQNEIGKYVLLTPITGDMNSSINSLSVYEGGGYFRYLSNESHTLRIEYTVNNVRVKDVSTNVFVTVSNGSSYSFGSGVTVEINWSIVYAPLLPIMFILGMIGLLSLVGGSCWSGYLIRKKEFRRGLVDGVIYVTIGFALVLAWLWA